jgi:hypothetical protein
MEDAAEVAEATGDVFVAANTYVDAAFIAIAEDYDGKTREFVADARDVAGSEYLTDAERASILLRIDGAPAGVASATVALAQRFGTLQSLALAD